MYYPPVINALPFGSQEPGYTKAYRNPKSFEDFQYFPTSKNGQKLITLQECFLEAVKNYGPKKFLGSRNPLKNNKYEFKTYDQVYQISQCVGSGILNLKLQNFTQDERSGPINVVGICSKSREEWSCVDIACSLYNLTLIPFYDTSDPQTQTFVIKLGSLQTVFCSGEVLEQNFKRMTDFGTLKQIVTFDKISIELIEFYYQHKIKILSFSDVIQEGKIHICPFVKSTPSTPFSFCFTSGTTGDPKGALLLNKNILSYIASVSLQDIKVYSEDVHLSYLPLAHVFERGVWWGMAFNGCTINYSSGDIALLGQDLVDVKPTVFITVARILNKFYDSINADIKNFEPQKRELAMKAIQTKLENFRKEALYKHEEYDKMFFNEIRNKYLGGNIRWMCTGAAPVAIDIMEFLKVVFCCPVLEGYGQTENCGLNFHSLAKDNISGHTGGPFSNTEYRLMDLAHMGYTSNDKDEQGNKIERGEILMRGPCVFGGYFKNPKKTAEAIDKDGWLHTNDVGQIMKNGGLKIIDRVNNIFKMAQGEYIAPDKVQNIYAQCPFVQECFIYGDSLREYLVGIIVPSENVMKKTAASMNIVGDFTTLCKNQQLTELVLQSMRDVGKDKGLKGYEQVKKIYLEPVSMINLGILTTSLKLKRKEAKQHFQQIIENLYNQANLKQTKL